MSLLGVFTGSFQMLRKEPKLFLPRLITTALYTGVMIYLSTLAARVVSASNSPGPADPTIAFSLFSDMGVLAVFLVFLMAIDLLSYAMYPALVRDHQAGGKIQLMSSIKEALGAWKILLALGFMIVLIAVAAGMIILPVEIFFPQLINEYGITGLVVLAAIASIIALVPMMLLFFVVPIGVLEKKGAIASFAGSVRLGMKHGKDLFTINLFLLLITVAVYAFMTYADVYAQGAAAFYSMLVFVAVRLVQAVVYTYISVINPYVYMKIR